MSGSFEACLYSIGKDKKLRYDRNLEYILRRYKQKQERERDGIRKEYRKEFPSGTWVVAL